MKTFVVFQNQVLTTRTGDLIATGGESVRADHPAVLALTDPASIGRFVGTDDSPVDAPLAATNEAPAVEAGVPEFRVTAEPEIEPDAAPTPEPRGRSRPR